VVFARTALRWLIVWNPHSPWWAPIPLGGRCGTNRCIATWLILGRTFVRGACHCLGHTIGNTQVEIAYRTVFERVPTPHLAIAIIVTTSTHLETSALPPGQRCPIGISHNHFGIRHAYGPGHMIAEMWRGAHAPPTRWGREVVVVGVRQVHGVLGIGSAANAAVSAAEKPRPAKQGW
jgi:hypothetical protein